MEKKTFPRVFFFFPKSMPSRPPPTSTWLIICDSEVLVPRTYPGHNPLPWSPCHSLCLWCNGCFWKSILTLSKISVICFPNCSSELIQFPNFTANTIPNIIGVHSCRFLPLYGKHLIYIHYFLSCFARGGILLLCVMKHRKSTSMEDVINNFILLIYLWPNPCFPTIIL